MRFAASMKSSRVSRYAGADLVTGGGSNTQSLRGDETHQDYGWSSAEAETGNQESGRTQMKQKAKISTVAETRRVGQDKAGLKPGNPSEEKCCLS